MLISQHLKTTKCYGVTALWRCADLLKNVDTIPDLVDTFPESIEPCVSIVPVSYFVQ